MKTIQHIPVITNVDEAETVIAEIATLEAERVQIEHNYYSRFERLRKIQNFYQNKAKEELGEKEDKINSLIEGVYLFANKNKKKLLEGDSKTIILPKGSNLSWKLSPLRLQVKKAKEVIAYLQEKGLTEYLRIKVTLKKNELKEAMQRTENPIEVPNAKLVQKEAFWISPIGLDKSFKRPESIVKSFFQSLKKLIA